MQHNKYVTHQDVKIYCATNQFPELQFIGTHNKSHGICGLGKHSHMRYDTKLGHVTCTIRRIPCACTPFASILDQPWVTGITVQKQPCYQTITYCTYWPVLGSFNNWKILQLSHKATSSE